MADYAVHDGATVVNVVVAGSQEVAEETTGLFAIEVVDGTPWIEWTLEADGWRPPPPYPSWPWDDHLRAYVPPLAEPEPLEEGGMHVWNESENTWVYCPPPNPVEE